MTIGNVLRRRRLEYDMTLTQVAKLVTNRYGKCVSKEMISAMELGKSNPPANLLRQLAVVYDVDVDWLFYLSGRISPEVRALNIPERDYSWLTGEIKKRYEHCSSLKTTGLRESDPIPTRRTP